MEYISHGDLRRHFRQPLPEDEAQTIARQLVDALRYMHENRYIHRDLKPEVCILSQPGCT